MSANDGGPAFPQALATSHDGTIYASYERAQDTGGMTLRDWFAGQALGRLAEYANGNRDKVAKVAYEWADAMLTAREP